MARFLARQVVARGWARRCTQQLAYAIGVAEPVSFLVDAEGCDAARNRDIPGTLAGEFSLTPDGIIRCLDLQRPIYYGTAATVTLDARTWTCHGNAPSCENAMRSNSTIHQTGDGQTKEWLAKASGHMKGWRRFDTLQQLVTTNGL